MGKFCKVYQVPCACITCKDVDCAHSPKTRGEAEIMRMVKLSVDGNVIDDDTPAPPSGYSEPKRVSIDESTLISETPRDRGLFTPTVLILSALFSAGVLLIAAYYVIGIVKPKPESILVPDESTAEVAAASADDQQPVENKTEPEPAPTMSIEEVLNRLKANSPPQSELPPPPPVVEELPKKLENLRTKGNDLVQKGDFASARQYYRAAINADPLYYQGYNNLANTYSDEGNQEQAEPIYAKGLEIEPASSNLRFNLGNAHFRAGRWEEALEQFNQVLTQNPGDQEAHLLAGVAHFKVGRFDEAAAHFRAITTLNPENGAAFYNLSLAYRRQGQDGLAQVAYRDAIRLMPELRASALR